MKRDYSLELQNTDSTGGTWSPGRPVTVSAAGGDRASVDAAIAGVDKQSWVSLFGLQETHTHTSSCRADYPGQELCEIPEETLASN